MDGMGLGLGWMDLCAGLLYEHRFAMLIILHLVKVRFVGEKMLKVVTFVLMQMREFLRATKHGRIQHRTAEYEQLKIIHNNTS